MGKSKIQKSGRRPGHHTRKNERNKGTAPEESLMGKRRKNKENPRRTRKQGNIKKYKSIRVDMITSMFIGKMKRLRMIISKDKQKEV